MKPFNYYTTHKTIYPNKRDYITYYVYDKGKCLYTGSYSDISKEELKKDFPNAVIQEVMNDEAFKGHLRQHNEESRRLYEEFQNDLFKDYGVSDNPKRFKCFALAWERGHSSGYSQIYGVFGDFVELIQ